MKKRWKRSLALASLGLSVPLVVWSVAQADPPAEAPPAAQVEPPAATETTEPAAESVKAEPIVPAEIGESVKKGLNWLAEAQHEDGGWGGGSHAMQQVRDPHAVPTDPASTAFTAMAFLRCGHTPSEGEYKDVVKSATEYLLATVEKSDSESPLITDVKGTQPQSKLGPLVDTTVTTQYLARLVGILKQDDPLRPRVSNALKKCIHKLQSSQQENGAWVAGGWAPVLQSGLGGRALEIAQANGAEVDKSKLERYRNYNRGNIGAEGKAAARDGAGVELYAFSGALQANGVEAEAARQAIAAAAPARPTATAQPAEGTPEPVTAEPEAVDFADTDAVTKRLKEAGYDENRAAQLAQAGAQRKAQLDRLNDPNLLKGFGNNGGEEFLSFLMTSEALVVSGGEPWTAWNTRMHELLAKIQNADGSWNGHHCITSPVFCTAACVQVLTTDRDQPMLAKIVEQSLKTRTANEGAAEENKDQAAPGVQRGRGFRSSAVEPAYEDSRIRSRISLPEEVDGAAIGQAVPLVEPAVETAPEAVGPGPQSAAPRKR
jgi:hypothetical protein